MSEIALMRDILVPADLHNDASPAFVHALKLALLNRGVVNTVHAVSPGEKSHWTALPGVRAVLERWGILPATATIADYDALGIDVWYRTLAGSGPVDVVVNEADSRPTDLIVMMGHERAQIERILGPNVGEAVARRAHTRTLWIPETAQRYLVKPQDGTVSLRHVLIPVGDDGAQAAVDAAVALGASLGVPRAYGILLHTGGGERPKLTLDPAWAWDNRDADGSVVQSILDVSELENVDLIAIASRGHDSLLDMLRGNKTERVLHSARCPVLMAPLP